MAWKVLVYSIRIVRNENKPQKSFKDRNVMRRNDIRVHLLDFHSLNSPYIQIIEMVDMLKPVRTL